MNYIFRFTDDDGKPTGYFGMACANSLKDLFWQIDEHGDPNRCQVKKLEQTSICFKLDIEALEASETEPSESLLDTVLGDGFKFMDWPTDIYDL